MTAAFDGDDGVTPEIEAEVAAEIARLRAEGKLVVIEPRCKVCREAPIRKVVNTLLAQGTKRTAIIEVLETLNANRAKKDRITYHNVRDHELRHFDVSHPAAVTYKKIREKHAGADEKEFEDGVTAQVNVFSFLETVRLKGYQNLVDDDTHVPYSDGVKAAIKLHELLREDSGSQQIAGAYAQLNRIMVAMQATLPKELWPVFLANLEGNESTAIEGTVEADEFDPDIIDDDEDEDI